MTGTTNQDKATIRKIAGIASMVVGLPNFIVSVLLCFGGIAITILLGIIAYELYTGDGGDNPFAVICIVLILVLVVVGLIIAVIATILAFIFALAVGGQSLGGYYALRGKRFGRAVTLTFLGTAVSFLFGIGLVIYGIMGERWDVFQIGALVWGAYNIFASIVSLVAGIIMIYAKDTFRK
ncbi:MAG: hypothetical protein U9R75_02765, partial [Candidatus Thermoplasmatota archaeon]|nr:hypothetical protein [Candidatus Thermoplasmatota archaeon]